MRHKAPVQSQTPAGLLPGSPRVFQKRYEAKAEGPIKKTFSTIRKGTFAAYEYADSALFGHAFSALCTCNLSENYAKSLFIFINHGKPDKITAVFSLITLGISAFGAVDGLLLGYFQNKLYRRVKKDLTEGGWKDSVAVPMIDTWCDRHSLQLAARVTGHGAEYKKFALTIPHRLAEKTAQELALKGEV